MKKLIIFLLLIFSLAGCDNSTPLKVANTNTVIGHTMAGDKLKLTLSVPEKLNVSLYPEIENLDNGITQEALYVDGTNDFYWLKALGNNDFYYPMRHWKITN